MSHAQPSFPSDNCFESVLSTRSLSYVSTNDALRTPSLSGLHLVERRYARAGASIARMEWNTMAEYKWEPDDSKPDLPDFDDRPELLQPVIDSPLFVLPREIRDRIYAYCLGSESGTPVTWPASQRRHMLQPQLLRTCKIVHDEAGPLLYSINDVIFHHPSDANIFVRAIASPLCPQYMSYLILSITAQDIRLWMPYITSRDRSRSLKSDYPNLRRLCVRYSSTKWHPGLSPAVNMNAVITDDPRLEEILKGLQLTYIGKRSKVRDGEASMKPLRATCTRTRLDSPAFTDPRHNARKSSAGSTMEEDRANTPDIRVICACRIQPAHYLALTSPEAATAGTGAPHLYGLGADQQNPTSAVWTEGPVQEGQHYQGFTPRDLREDIKDLLDPSLPALSTSVARTPFVEKGGALVALEVHCTNATLKGMEQGMA